jgi:hypothetical protein
MDFSSWTLSATSQDDRDATPSGFIDLKLTPFSESHVAPVADQSAPDEAASGDLPGSDGGCDQRESGKTGDSPARNASTGVKTVSLSKQNAEFAFRLPR